MDEPRVGLVAALSGLSTTADIDVTVVIEGEDPYIVRFGDGRCQLVEAAEPDREITLWVSREGAERVTAGEANAQQLLAEGALRVAGHLDILQEQASALIETQAG